MPINFCLYDNPMTPDPNDRRAMIVETTMRTRLEVINQITGPGSILKPTECEAVLTAFFKQLGTNLEQGDGYQDEFMSLQPNMQGVFVDDNDTYSPSRHKLYPNMMPGQPLKDAISKAKVKKVSAKENMPTIKEFMDLKSRTTNETATRGGMVKLVGDLLKLNEVNEDEGVFFIKAGDETETKAAFVHENLPKTLMIEVPETLTAGEYYIEVRNRRYQGKSLRNGRLKPKVNVPA